MSSGGSNWWASSLEAYQKITINDESGTQNGKNVGTFRYFLSDDSETNLNWKEVTSEQNKIDFSLALLKDDVNAFYKMVLAYQSSKFPATLNEFAICTDDTLLQVDSFVNDLHNTTLAIQRRASMPA